MAKELLLFDLLEIDCVNCNGVGQLLTGNERFFSILFAISAFVYMD